MRATTTRVSWYSLGLLTLVLALGRTVSATATSSVPEIDGASVSTGVALLAGGILILRARLRK